MFADDFSTTAHLTLERKQSPHLAVLLRTQDKLPVIWRPPERIQFHGDFLRTLVEDADDRIVILSRL